MKKSHLFLFICCVLACAPALAGPCGALAAGSTLPTDGVSIADTELFNTAEVLDIPAGDLGTARYRDFPYAGGNRTYLLYVPDKMSEGAPLVFVLHGYYGFASSFMNETGFNAVADQYGFGVVYPQGAITSGSGFACTHWNADFTFTDTDDTGFLSSLAKHLQDEIGFNGNNTFAAGLSNGGFMCYALAVNSPGTFRAIASVAGTMSRGTWDKRENAMPTPVLQIHGSADTVVPIDGSMTAEGGWGGAPDMDGIIRFWADRNNARQMETIQTGNMTQKQYNSDTGKTLVSYCLIKDFGHAWPTAGNSGFDANEAIWTFFDSLIE